MLYRVVSGQPDLASMPPGLREIVAACLAKNPAGRPGLAALAAMISRDGRCRGVADVVLARPAGRGHPAPPGRVRI